MTEQLHGNYFDISGSSPFDYGVTLGEVLRAQSHAWVDRKFSDPLLGEKIDRARDYLELTGHYFPQYIEELLGQAKSLGLSLDEMWAFSLEEELDFLDSPSERCTTVVSRGGLLLGHTEDEDLGSQDSVVVLRKQINDVTALELYFLGTLGGNGFSINSHGVASTRNVLADFDTQFGLPRNTVARYLSETGNPRQDLARISRMPRRMGNCTVFTTHSGEVIAAETTARNVVIFTPDMPYVHTNHYLVPELQPYDHTENATSTFERYARASEIASPEMSMPDMTALLEDQSMGPQKSIFNERTIAKAVVDWSQLSVLFWLQREQEKGWVRYDLDFVHDHPV